MFTLVYLSCSFKIFFNFIYASYEGFSVTENVSSNVAWLFLNLVETLYKEKQPSKSVQLEQSQDQLQLY